MSREYSQPDFYHFNSDSLLLVEWISQNAEIFEHVLDLGCGCGVIGIEIARTLKINKLTFLEFQRDYESYLLENISKFVPTAIEVDIKWTSFSQVELNDSYDLIVCNPPYYLPGHGQVSNNEQRMIARTFMKDSWDDLLHLIDKSLSKEGKAFLVVKDDQVITGHILNKIKNFKLFLKQVKSRDVLFLEIFRLNEY